MNNPKEITYKIQAYLPKNLSLEQLITEHDPYQYGIENFDMDHAKYLLSQISEVLAADERQVKNFDDIATYTHLKAEILQSVVQHYKFYLDYFTEINVIECNGYYRPAYLYPGEKGETFGYRFTYHYQFSDLIESNYSDRFTKLLVRRRKKYINKLYIEYGHLTKWHEYLHIDAETAYRYITIRRDAQLTDTLLLDYKRDKDTGEKKPVKPIEQYKSNKINISKINLGLVTCFVDQTVHRMHYPLSTLKKILRNLIVYKKNDIKYNLISIDIKNSQPYLLTLLFSTSNIEKVKKICKRSGYTSVNLMLKKLYETFEKEGFMYADVILFKQLVSDFPDKPKDKDGKPHDLYTYMLEKCEQKNIHYGSRDEVKNGMFAVLFGSTKLNTPTKKLFANLFPTIWQSFCIIKEQNKRDLSCLLQSIESYFILKIVTKKFAKAYPNAPLYTIHDSIITTEPYKESLYVMMKSELTKLVGLVPVLVEEEWLPKYMDWDKYTNAFEKVAHN